ncbi:hypothetical protein ANCDUO_26758 [Ancylostoma duodenale]|uniref:Uncharacterized protein n=1 Tax=Ancylostoma duodenale TaxID=51022 RepID=A0A0C2FDW4_9BILA|nr:hypothetical protein ANCDUO_26758 [Ancylostoma duodenale]
MVTVNSTHRQHSLSGMDNARHGPVCTTETTLSLANLYESSASPANDRDDDKIGRELLVSGMQPMMTSRIPEI